MLKVYILKCVLAQLAVLYVTSKHKTSRIRPISSALNGTWSFCGFDITSSPTPNALIRNNATHIAIQDKRWYWWRSQAVAYLLRLNDRTREEIDRRTQLYFPVGSPPPGSISAHVRHGDKVKGPLQENNRTSPFPAVCVVLPPGRCTLSPPMYDVFIVRT